jgi:hypothetical protein
MIYAVRRLLKAGNVKAYLEFDGERGQSNPRDIVITVRSFDRDPVVVDAIYLDCSDSLSLSALGVVGTSEGATVTSDHVSLDNLVLMKHSYCPITITAKDWWRVRGATVHWHSRRDGHRYTTRVIRKNPWGAVGVIK